MFKYSIITSIFRKVEKQIDNLCGCIYLYEMQLWWQLFASRCASCNIRKRQTSLLHLLPGDQDEQSSSREYGWGTRGVVRGRCTPGPWNRNQVSSQKCLSGRTPDILQRENGMTTPEIRFILDRVLQDHKTIYFCSEAISVEYFWRIFLWKAFNIFFSWS